MRQSVADELESVVVGDLANAVREEDPEAARSLARSAKASVLSVIIATLGTPGSRHTMGSRLTANPHAHMVSGSLMSCQATSLCA